MKLISVQSKANYIAKTYESTTTDFFSLIKEIVIDSKQKTYYFSTSVQYSNSQKEAFSKVKSFFKELKGKGPHG